MSESLASWITLSALLLSAIILLVRNPDRSAQAILMNLVTAVLCMFGGLLIAAVTMKLLGGIENPIVSSVLVVVGALLCVAGKEKLGPQKRLSK